MSRTKFFALCLVASCPLASASDPVGISAWTPEVYSISASTGATSLIGTYVLAAPEEFRMGVLARGLDGTLYGISDSQNESRIYRIDEATGAATVVHTITTGPVSPMGATVDVITGELYYTNTFGFVPWPQMYRVDLESGAVTFLGNIGPNIKHFQIGPACDPFGTFYSVNGDMKALQIVDKNDPLNASIVVGPLGGSIDLLNNAALYWDDALQSLVLYEGATGNLYTIDRTTGAATAVPGVTGIAPAMVDIEAGPCDGAVISYGAGCVGSGGITPRIRLLGCPVVGNHVTLQIDKALGGSTAALFFGATTASFPLGAGCSFLVAPVLPPFVVPTFGSGPGDGFFTLAGILPASVAGATFTSQALILDGASPIGWAATNGVQVSIP